MSMCNANDTHYRFDSSLFNISNCLVIVVNIGQSCLALNLERIDIRYAGSSFNTLPSGTSPWFQRTFLLFQLVYMLWLMLSILPSTHELIWHPVFHRQKSNPNNMALAGIVQTKRNNNYDKATKKIYICKYSLYIYIYISLFALT